MKKKNEYIVQNLNIIEENKMSRLSNKSQEIKKISDFLNKNQSSKILKELLNMGEAEQSDMGLGRSADDFNEALKYVKENFGKEGARFGLGPEIVKSGISESDILSGLAKIKKANDNLNARVKARGQGKVRSRFSDDVRGMSAKELKGSGFEQYENKPYEKIIRKIQGFTQGGDVKGNNQLKGGQKKLDKNKDGKISGEDFKMLRNMEDGGKVQKLEYGGEVGNTCRGGGAAIKGTKFVGVR